LSAPSKAFALSEPTKSQTTIQALTLRNRVIIFFKPFETNLNANYKQHQAGTLIGHRRNS
jgi:hypothetical protein